MLKADSISRRPVLAGGAAAAVLLFAGPGAGAADAVTSTPQVPKVRQHVKPTSARVVRFAAPADHALVRSSTVPVRVKAGPQVIGVKVYAGTKDVSRRFARHGGAFTARLPRSLFKPGTNRLLVQAKTRGDKAGGAAHISIVIPRSTPGQVNLATGAHAASVLGANPAADPGYLPSTPGQIPVAIHSKTATYARLTVNRHRVSDLRARRPLQDHHWLVSAGDGLRVGDNRFVVESWDKQGRHTIKRWTVERDGSRPLAEAGPRERVVEPKAWTTLDGSKTRATRKAAKLTYAWRVVKAPKGAKPQLRNATAAKPRFQPDKPGVYQIALRATQAKPGVAAAAADQASEDVTTIDAVPTLGAQGLYVDTGLIGGVGASGIFNTMWIEGDGYSFDNDNVDSATDTFVQLDETTLAVIHAGTSDQVKPAPGTITIGAWDNRTVPYSSDQYGSMIWIGTTQVAANTTPTSPGANVGNPTSNLHGWIQPATVANTDDATWIDSDMLQVKTRLPTDTPTTNTIEINDQQFHMQLPAGAQGGYQLLELDNSGAWKWDQKYPITGNAGTDATTLNNLASDISNATKNTTFLLQGFGNLPAIGSDTNLGNVLQNIGGRADVVDRFNGKTDSTGGVYALIAGPSPTAKNTWSNYAAEEASFERTGTTGTLSALLIRDAAANNYIPFTADSAAPDPIGTSRNSFLPTVYSTPVDWTNWIRNDDGSLGKPTDPQAAAYSDLVSQVQSHHWVPATKLCPAAPDAIRGYYCDTDPDALGVLLNRISNQLKFNPTTAGSRYAESDWDTAQFSIEDELGDVSNIRSAIADYQGLFGTASIDGVVNAPAIGDAIKAAINKSTTTATTADMNNILSAFTDMASVIPEIGPEMTWISGWFGLNSSLEPGSTADDVLGPVQVTQDTAAATLVAAFQDASTRLSHYGDILVSDPTKLQSSANFLLDNDPQTTDSNSAFVHAAEYATQQWLWGTELASTYSVWVVPRVFGYSPECASSDGYSVGYPWEELQPSGAWISGIGVGGGHDDWHWLLGYDGDTTNPSDSTSFEVKNGHAFNDISLPGSITNALFGRPISSTTEPSVTANAGALMPIFALDYLGFKWPPEMAQSHWELNPNTSGCEPHAGIPSTLP